MPAARAAKAAGATRFCMGAAWRSPSDHQVDAVAAAVREESMSDELQTLCLHAGANSIFLGEVLLTTTKAGPSHDHLLLDKLGMHLTKEPVASR